MVGVHRPKPPSPKRPFSGRNCWRLGRRTPIPEIRRTLGPERSRFPSSVSGIGIAIKSAPHETVPGDLNYTVMQKEV